MNGCSCNKYKDACSYKPGWFKPEELEATAKLLGLSIGELFKTKLAVDWYGKYVEGNGVIGDVFLIAPVLQGEEAGTKYPDNPSGTCIFFKDGLCEIHEAKPYECSQYNHDDSYSTSWLRHKKVAASWKDHQGVVEKLLGRTIL